ncbi:HD domain-containing protein [Gracilimonas sediminicola]|uniref:HD domain-containing protein n=1 Tax=Gracilimonas sediminicola TaxID=2952158 RepID=UPI0038D5072A
MKERALKIVHQEFAEITDKAGKPYICHLQRVAERTENSEKDEGLYCIALLHDLLEDIEAWTAEKLKDYFPIRVVEAVVLLTKSENQSYSDYINQISGNPDARAVKLADLEDNMNITRLDRISENDIKRLRKYHKAFKKLITGTSKPLNKSGK